MAAPIGSAGSQSADSRMKNEKIAIVGSGLIGRSWAMLFAAAGYHVVMTDIDAEMIKDALSNILLQLKDLESTGLLRGTLSVQQQHGLISGTTDIKECVKGAKYVQECTPERINIKKSIFEQIDSVAGDTTILASSTSSLPASRFSENLKHRSRVIVVHPTNPPYYCPATEICPTPWTDPQVTADTIAIQKEIGQTPLLIKKELEGFVLNRMQYALMNECVRLVQDDVISVEDIDKVVKEGLGMRWAFVGPLETAHLNANGMKDYCERYGENMYKTVSEFGPVPKWHSPEVERIAAGMDELIPLDQLTARRRWRDKRLVALAKLKKDMAAKDQK